MLNDIFYSLPNELQSSIQSEYENGLLDEDEAILYGFKDEQPDYSSLDSDPKEYRIDAFHPRPSDDAVEAPETPVEGDTGECEAIVETSADTPIEAKIADVEGATDVPVGDGEGEADQTAEKEKKQSAKPITPAAKKETGIELLELLDPRLKQMILNGRKRLPVDVTALGYWSMYASQIRSLICIDDEDIPVLVSGLVVANSGMGKSELSKRIFKPIERKQSQLEVEYEEAHRIWQEKQQQENPPNDPEPYPVDIWISGQGTLPGVKKYLTDLRKRHIRPSIFIYEQEGSGFFESHNRNCKGKGEGAGWTKIIDNEPINDKQVEHSYKVRDYHATLYSEIQPRVFRVILKKRQEDLWQGMFSRFIYAIVPIVKAEHIKHSNKRRGKNNSNEKTLADYLLDIVMTKSPEQLFISDEALEVYQEYSDFITDYKNENLPKDTDLDEFFVSLHTHSMNKVLSVAAVAHILNWAVKIKYQEAVEISDTIEADEMKFAVSFIRHFNAQLVEEFNRVGGNTALTSRNPDKDAEKKLCKSIFNRRKHKGKDTTFGTAQRCFNFFTGKTEYLRKIIARCIEDGYIYDPFDENDESRQLSPDTHLELTQSGENLAVSRF